MGVCCRTVTSIHCHARPDSLFVYIPDAVLKKGRGLEEARGLSLKLKSKGSGNAC